MGQKATVRKTSDSREKLLDAVLGLVWQSNYDSVGINEICESAGVTKGCFYHHYESKAALFYAAAQYYWEGMKQELDRIFSPDQTALEQLESMIQFIIEKQRAEIAEHGRITGCPFFTSGAQCGTGEEMVRRSALEMSEKVVRYSTALVRNLLQEENLASPCDPVQMGRMVHEYIHGLMMYAELHQQLPMLAKDLREGLYRLLDVKPEARRRAVAIKA